MNVTQLPGVDQIRGLRLVPHELPELAKVELQYTGPGNAWYQLDMPFLDALHLLNQLEQLSKDSGHDHLRRPPGG